MLGCAPDEAPTPGGPPPGTFGAYVVTDEPDSLSGRSGGGRGGDHGAAGHRLRLARLRVRDPEGNRWSFGTYRGEPRAS